MCYNPEMKDSLDSELKSMWKEKLERESPPVSSDDDFEPAKLAEPNPEDKVLIHIDL
jgi:hypothetical protein